MSSVSKWRFLCLKRKIERAIHTKGHYGMETIELKIEREYAFAALIKTNETPS